MQAHIPLCSGAIAYTRAGAQRVLEHCVPIFDGIDGMLPALVSNGSLRALAAAPPLFYQDGYWGTDAGRLQGHSAVNFTQDTASAHVTKPQHFIYLPPCSMITDSNMSLIGSNLVNALRGQEEEGFVDDALTRRIRVPAAAPSLLLNNVQVHGPEQEAYFAARGTTCHADAIGVLYSHSAGAGTAPGGTGEGGGTGAFVQSVSLDPAGFEVPVGAWTCSQAARATPGQAQDLVLHVPPASSCWRHADSVGVLSLCLLKLVWHSHSGDSGIDLYYQHILVFINGTGRGPSWPPPSDVADRNKTRGEDGRLQEEVKALVNDEFVGRLLAVYWAHDDRWYSARVVSLDPSSGAHVVEYEDGLQEIFDIAVADRRFLRLE